MKGLRVVAAAGVALACAEQLPTVRKATPEALAAPRTPSAQLVDRLDSTLASIIGQSQAAQATRNLGGRVHTLEASDVMDSILSAKASLADCVRLQRRAAPSLTGKLVLVWDVAPDGSVTGVGVLSRELEGSLLASCVQGVVATIRFRPHETPLAPIAFPFKF